MLNFGFKFARFTGYIFPPSFPDDPTDPLNLLIYWDITNSDGITVPDLVGDTEGPAYDVFNGRGRVWDFSDGVSSINIGTYTPTIVENEAGEKVFYAGYFTTDDVTAANGTRFVLDAHVNAGADYMYIAKSSVADNRLTLKVVSVLGTSYFKDYNVFQLNTIYHVRVFSIGLTTYFEVNGNIASSFVTDSELASDMTVSRIGKNWKGKLWGTKIGTETFSAIQGDGGTIIGNQGTLGTLTTTSVEDFYAEVTDGTGDSCTESGMTISDGVTQYFDELHTQLIPAGVFIPPAYESTTHCAAYLSNGELAPLQYKPKLKQPLRIVDVPCADVSLTDEIVVSPALPMDATMDYTGDAVAVLDVPASKVTFTTVGTFYDLSFKSSFTMMSDEWGTPDVWLDAGEDIQAALTTYDNVGLNSGTHNLTAVLIIAVGKTVQGAGFDSILDVSAIPGSENVATVSGTLANLRVLGDNSVLGTNANQISCYGKVNQVEIVNHNYGIMMFTGSSVKNIWGKNLKMSNGWSALIHAKEVTGSNITIRNIYGIDCDRYIEIEDGATDIDAKNGNAINIGVGNPEGYTFVLGCHSHIDQGHTACHRISFDNFYLEGCAGGMLAEGDSDAEGDGGVATDISFSNIEIVNPATTGHAVFASKDADRVMFDSITIKEADEDNIFRFETCDNVTGSNITIDNQRVSNANVINSNDVIMSDIEITPILPFTNGSLLSFVNGDDVVLNDITLNDIPLWVGLKVGASCSGMVINGITGTSGTDTTSCIEVNAPDCTFNNCNFSGILAGGYGVRIRDGGERTTINNSSMEGLNITWAYGIYIDNSAITGTKLDCVTYDTCKLEANSATVEVIPC